jgi:ABC-type multidrug transport system permease subunit
MKKLSSIIKISLKSYYLRTNNLIVLLFFPILTIVLFLQQTGGANIKNLIIGSILLSSSLICINTLSRNIAIDKSFNRLWLYEVPNYKLLQYFTGISLSALFFVILVNLYFLSICSIFIPIHLSFNVILNILFLSILTWLILSPMGLIIGLFTKNIMDASSISSMLTAIIITFSSSYSNNYFKKISYLNVFSQLLPVTHLGNFYRYILNVNINISIISIKFLMLFFIIELILLLYFLRKFLKNTSEKTN